MLSPDERDRMIDRLIDREGGYVNHPQDPGGETKYGISKRSYPDLDIAGLTREQAHRIYATDFYRRFNLDKLDNPRTAEWVLDWLVHSGPSAIRWIQQKLGVQIDGVVGPQTLTALNRMQDPRDLLRWRLDRLVGLTGHPFIKGWVRRLVELGL